MKYNGEAKEGEGGPAARHIPRTLALNRVANGYSLDCLRVKKLIPVHIPRLLWLIWICFVLRGLFYASMLPLWEGYDEWSHFAYVQHLAASHGLPVVSETPVSLEVQESLQLVPLPWMMRNYQLPHVTHDEFWRLPEPEREDRQQRLLSLPRNWAERPGSEGLRIYEAQQPPFYYWLMSWPLRVFSGSPLAERVILLRWLNVVVASLFVPLGFLTARRVFGHEGTALGVIALAAVMPELLADVCRVGNEGLALAIYSALIYLGLRVADRPDHFGEVSALGVVLSLGLLTKIYFLTALPALGGILVWALWKHRVARLQIGRNALLAAALVLLVSGPLLWRNLRLTGRWSGLIDDVAVEDLSLWERLQFLPDVDWRNALDSIFLSHIWFGNWSFLQLRAWIYHVFALAAALALAGLMVWVARGKRELVSGAPRVPQSASFFVLGGLYGFFWLGLAYHVLLVYLANGYSTSAGWYLYCLVVAEVILTCWGLRAVCPSSWGRFVAPAGTIAFALLDLYGMHFVLIPYYTGLISHRPDGSIASFYVSQIQTFPLSEIVHRMGSNKPVFLASPVMAALWALYLGGTAGLVLIAISASRNGSNRECGCVDQTGDTPAKSLGSVPPDL